MADSNNTMTSRDQNVIYESTPDGDIRTIVKDDPSNENSDNNGGIDSDLFQRHLRKSWDLDDGEAALAGEKDGGDGNTSSAPPPKHRHNRHKHNLSVQFLDISISEDITNNKGSGQIQNNSNAVQRKDPSSTSMTTTKMDIPIPPPPSNISADTDPSPTHTRTKSALEVEAAAAYYFDENDESSPTKDDDIANFQKNVHSSWESGDEGEDSKNKQRRSVEKQGSLRGSFTRRRHRHNLSVQFTDDSFLGKDNDKGETVSNDMDDANAAFLRGTQQPPTASMSNREARAFEFGRDQAQQQQQQQKPTPPAGIVVPVPIVVRPTSVNRKHRRVYSGRSNPAMAHRRVNTRGDSTPTKGEVWAPIPTAPGGLPPPPPPPHHHPAHPPHPASAHPYPSPYYPQGAPPPPHPYGSAPTPPPYDPYYAATQPVDPRYYAPSPHHFNSSPASDGGVRYDARGSPMLYPTPPGGGGQYPPSAQSSPGGYYVGQPPAPLHAANLYARQPSNMSQTSLDRGQQGQQAGEDFQIDKNSAVSDRSKENANDGGNGGAHHHRKQSSLVSFLANSGFEDLFDDVDVGYDSAPDEQQSKRHSKSLSSASFMRSLSSDNFLKDHLQAVVEEKSNGSASPFASPLANSAPNATVDSYHQAYPGYYPYGPPQSASNWQDPNNYLRHSPIQAPPPSTQHRPLFGGGAAQLQFLPPSPPQQCVEVTSPNSADGSGQDAHQKRQRRKCSVPDCTNRVVQGGLCISHGAKRKTCAHPGCEKNVKAKGLCSTHGPARKRCNAEGCTKVAVQGGRCIAHGAKKKVCSYAECTKQAILGGMCKKHHDETHGVVKVRGSRKPKGESPASPRKGKPTHERGLSLFTDSSIVDTIISSGGLNEQQKDGL